MKLFMKIKDRTKSPKRVIWFLVSLAVILAGILLYPGKTSTAPDLSYRFCFMLEHNLLVTDQLTYESTSEAFENIRPSVVQIHVGSTYGGGSIWKIGSDDIEIITNRHVIQNFAAQAQTDVNSNYVTFFDGEAARVELIGVSAQYDVGLVKVPVSELTEAELCSLRSVRIDEAAWQKVAEGTTLFCVHSQDIMRNGPDDDLVVADGTGTGIADQSYIGVVSDTSAYIEDLGQNMMYCMCYAQAGMSGGGMFDAYGNLIGMVTGGTQQNETVSVSLPDILAACSEIENGK